MSVHDTGGIYLVHLKNDNNKKQTNKQINSKQNEMKTRKLNVFIIYKNVAVGLVVLGSFKALLYNVDKHNIIINLHVLSLSDFQQ